MSPLWLIVASLSYGAAALVFGFVTVLIAASHPGTRQGHWLVAASAVSLIWAVLLFAFVFFGALPESAALVVDAIFLASWVGCLAAMIESASSEPRYRRLPFQLTLGAAILVLSVLALALLSVDGLGIVSSRVPSYATLLGIGLVGLLAVEQIYRNAEFRQRRAWLPMSVAVGAIFASNVFVFSQAVLFGELLVSVWVVRGVIAALAAPLIVVAIKRQADWGTELFVSRHVVFYTASLFAAGLYLIAMAVGGYLVGASDLAWGPAAQIAFLVCAAFLLLYVIFSSAVRTRLKVFIAKHFYRNRYDYREEWLRLIKTLAAGNGQDSMDVRAIKALAAIIGSRSGDLWLRDSDKKTFLARPGWNTKGPNRNLSADDAIVDFLTERRWVIDTDEYDLDSEKYGNVFSRGDYPRDGPSVYVPLVHERELIGIVRLDRPHGRELLVYEDHDLLKTAGQQVAIFLAQERAKDELSETRQLEAFSKLTTFLMHDLKNLIAQQELVVGNAKTYGDRPEFIADAISTIDSGVQRMRRVLARLQEGFGSERVANVFLDKLLPEVCQNCADRRPVPTFKASGMSLPVAINRERLAAAIAHAIRNAQDATSPDGNIEVRLGRNGTTVIVEVEDNGAGMDADFVQNRLFKPFDSTKGARGMGIGAYQLRETLRAANGSVTVSSEPGRGTVLRMQLPLVAEPSAGSAA